MNTDPELCDHGVRVEFDAETAKDMTADEVQARYPRAHVNCALCGFTGVIYASEQHYYAGDW